MTVLSLEKPWITVKVGNTCLICAHSHSTQKQPWGDLLTDEDDVTGFSTQAWKQLQIVSRFLNKILNVFTRISSFWWNFLFPFTINVQCKYAYVLNVKRPENKYCLFSMTTTTTSNISLVYYRLEWFDFFWKA